MAKVDFHDIKQELQIKINELLKLSDSPKDISGFSLIDGFFYSPYQMDIGESYEIGGTNLIVNVAIIGNSTKVIHYYPVKALLPERLKDF